MEHAALQAGVAGRWEVVRLEQSTEPDHEDPQRMWSRFGLLSQEQQGVTSRGAGGVGRISKDVVCVLRRLLWLLSGEHL